MHSLSVSVLRRMHSLSVLAITIAPCAMRTCACSLDVHPHAHWMCMGMLTGCSMRAHWMAVRSGRADAHSLMYMHVYAHAASRTCICTCICMCICMCMHTQPHAHACAHAYIHMASQTAAAISQSTFAACMHIHTYMPSAKTAHACCKTIRQHNPHTSPHARSVR